MTEPLQIQVGEYEVYTLNDGALAWKEKGRKAELVMVHHDLIAALARELAEARKDAARLTNLIAAGPPGAAPNDMCLTSEAWDLGAGLVESPEDTDQVMMRKAMDLFLQLPGTGA